MTTNTHIVRSAETLCHISAEYGYVPLHRIMNESANASLFAERPHYNILCEGDQIVVPKRELPRLQLETGARHRVAIVPPRTRLSLLVRNPEREHFVGGRYTLEFSDRVLEGVLGDDGLIEVDLDFEVRGAELTLEAKQPTPESSQPPEDPDACVWPDTVKFEVVIGGLEPVEADRGVLEALANLGHIEYDESLRIDGLSVQRAAGEVDSYANDGWTEAEAKTIDDDFRSSLAAMAYIVDEHEVGPK